MITPLGLAARRLLVIAPHPDDEALGCGGLIAAFRADGRAVRVVFVTDGGASHAGSAAWSRARLAAERRSEAEASLETLGVSAGEAVFLDLPDADMPPEVDPAWRAAHAMLVETVAAFAPDLVAAPWRRDPHRDHRDAWRLATTALGASGARPRLLEYAVWLDELGSADDHPRRGEADTVELDIAPWLEIKHAAVARHRSQLTDLIADDPTGFRLSEQTLERLLQPVERYWRVSG